MSDQVARASGLFGGVIRRSAVTTATAPTTFTAPPAADCSGSLVDLGMDGNDRWANCFWAAPAHGMMFQACEGLDAAGAPSYVVGFVPPTEQQVIDWFQGYLTSQGLPTAPPGAGTDISSGAAYLLANVSDIEAVGVIAPNSDGTFDARLIREAIFDTQGGAIICWALDPDAQQEFENHQCWGAESANPDYNEGHATEGAEYDESGVTVATWGALECTTDLVDANCIDGLVVFVSKWLRARLGDSYADQVIAKWGLTTKAPAAPTPADPPSDGDVVDDAAEKLAHLVEAANHLREEVDELVKVHGVDPVMNVLTMIRRGLRS